MKCIIKKELVLLEIVDDDLNFTFQLRVPLSLYNMFG
ncbi:unnamed protein product [Brassica oleracea]